MEGSVTQCLCLLVSVLKHVLKVHGGPTQHTWGPLFTRRRAAEESIKIPDRNKLARVGTFHRCITASHLAWPRQLSEYERLFEIFRFHRRKLTAIKIRRRWTRGTRRPARRILMCLKMCEWAWQILSDCAWPMRVGAIELGPKQNSQRNYTKWGNNSIRSNAQPWTRCL